MKLSRLDILIYAHDGRGLGHASRSIGIGMALRRFFPALRILFVSGCRVSQELIGSVPLDWLKLPSYETEVVEGKSRGIPGNSLFTDAELGGLRSAHLEHLITLYRPRLVLSDHTPQGKHRELHAALRATVGTDTRWVLGVRGVVGAVSQVKSELARQLFATHYHGLLWYGDSAVLGGEHLQQLKTLYGQEPVECGYVSRLQELRSRQLQATASTSRFAGTVAVPWLGEKTLPFMRVMAEALEKIGAEYGTWRLFISMGDSEDVGDEVHGLFAGLANCNLEPPSGARYVEALLSSKSAVIYGGYNSLMDVLSLQLPALVVLRDMQDSEQQIHLEKLREAAGDLFTVVEESTVKVQQLQKLLIENLKKSKVVRHAVDLNGAERAAQQLVKMLPEQE
jgi:predicted glycosyltransferase